MTTTKTTRSMTTTNTMTVMMMMTMAMVAVTLTATAKWGDWNGNNYNNGARQPGQQRHPKHEAHASVGIGDRRQETGGNDTPKALTSLPLLQAQQSCHSQRQRALVATMRFCRGDTLCSSLSITTHINEGGLGIKSNKQQFSGLSPRRPWQRDQHGCHPPQWHDNPVCNNRLPHG